MYTIIYDPSIILLFSMTKKKGKLNRTTRFQMCHGYCGRSKPGPRVLLRYPLNPNCWKEKKTRIYLECLRWKVKGQLGKKVNLGPS